MNQMASKMHALVVSGIPWGQSNRGIDILTETLLDKGFRVDHMVFPVYKNIKRVSGDKAKGEIYRVKPNQIFAGKTYLPYDEDTMYFLPSIAMRIIHNAHLKSVNMIDFKKYNLIVLESGKPVMLVDLTPHNTILIYRQSDPVWMLYRNKYLLKYEEKTIERADLVLVVRQIFKNYIPKKFYKKTLVWVNGFSIPDNFLDVNPYKSGTKNGVYLGFSPLDYKTVKKISEDHKDCQFHIIGTEPSKLFGKKIRRLKNVHFYGYLRPYEYIRYIKYADFSFMPSLVSNNIFNFVGLTSKFLLSMYFNLPIISYKVGNEAEFDNLPVFFASSPEDFSKKISYIKKMSKIHYNIDYSFFNREGRKKELLEILKTRLGV